MNRPPRSAVDLPYQSFDVFDTCLVRTYLDPDDLVYDCAERVLSARAHRSVTPEEVAELAELRIAGHRQLLTATDRDEVRLDEVYAAMGDLARFGTTSAAMHRQELELERSSSRAVVPMAAQVAGARARGQQILFLSDMWLPADVVRDLLLAAGIAEPDDLVRVSSTSGRSKWTGRLFQDVLSELGIAPHELHHRGDNPRTDYAVPSSMGIAATLVDPTRLSRYEELALAGDGARHVRSRLAGASRCVRLSYDDPPGSLEAAATALAAGVAGPLLTAFVTWTLEQARQDGVARLLFVARDGQIMQRSAQALMADAEGPALSYLHVSRRSLLLATLPDIRPASLEEVLPPPPSRTPRRALASVGVAVDDVAAAATAVGLGPSTWDLPCTGAATTALQELLTAPPVAARISDVVNTAREGVLGYLEQEGMLGTQDWALVDIGWNLRLQAVLRRLTGRTDDRPLGYYLGARPDGVARSRPGPYRAFLLQGYHEPGATAPGAAVFREHTVVEALLTPGDHGSVQGYRRCSDGWEPVHGAGPDDARQRYVQRLHDGVVRYAVEMVADGLLPVHAAQARQHGLAATTLFLLRPRAEELVGLRALRHADDVAQEVQQPVVVPLTPVWAARVALGRIRSQPRSRLVWKGGSIAVSGGVTRRALQLLDRPVDPRLRALKARLERAAGRTPA